MKNFLFFLSKLYRSHKLQLFEMKRKLWIGISCWYEFNWEKWSMCRTYLTLNWIRHFIGPLFDHKFSLYNFLSYMSRRRRWLSTKCIRLTNCKWQQLKCKIAHGVVWMKTICHINDALSVKFSQLSWTHINLTILISNWISQSLQRYAHHLLVVGSSWSGAYCISTYFTVSANRKCEMKSNSCSTLSGDAWTERCAHWVAVKTTWFQQSLHFIRLLWSWLNLHPLNSLNLKPLKLFFRCSKKIISQLFPHTHTRSVIKHHRACISKHMLT